MYKYLIKTFKTFLVCVIAMAATTVASAQIRVSGTVTDENGNPTAGVTVLVEGTVNGTMTDKDGNWELSVSNPETAVIQFSCLGYVTVRERLRNRATLMVVMEENSEELEEIVVVGYGTQKKVNLTGSVSAVDFSQLSENRSILDPQAALEGLVPGMMVREQTGLPGNETCDIRIRGRNSFTSGAYDPLVLVDGVEWDMNNVNPADIESISVLKDAASTAIYGARGASGVILVTTKNGSEGKPRISYSYSGFFQTADNNNLGWINNYADWMEYCNEACDMSGVSHYFSQTIIDLWREKEADPYGVNEYGMPNYMAYPNTDWFDYIFHTAYSQRHNLSITGGGKNFRYMISGSYTDNSGVIDRDSIDSSSQDATFRTNLEVDATKWLTVGAKIYYKFQAVGTADLSYLWSYLYHTDPGVYPGEMNKWGRISNSEDDESTMNPMDKSSNTRGTKHKHRFNMTAFAKVKPYKGITIEGSINYIPYYQFNHTYIVPHASWDYYTDTLYEMTDQDNANMIDATKRNYSMNTEVLVRYDNVFKKDHALNVLLGYTTNSYLEWTTEYKKKGPSDWSLHEATTYATVDSVTGSTRTGWNMRSYFARVNYAYKDRYLFEGNVRLDGSSKFGSDNRWGVFPSFSAGWKIHEESWMAGASNWLSLLKLRASWGQAGNDQGIGNYTWQATYSSGGVVIDGTETQGLYIDSMSNQDLRWETSTTTDVGLDVAFFKGRLSAEMDYYYRATRDILYTPSTYMTMGNFSSVAQNQGRLWNQGFEISLNWKDTVGKGFHYSVGVNFSYNKNKVTKFKGKLSTGYDENGEFYTNYSDVAESWGSPGVLLEDHALGEHYILKRYTGTGAGYSGGAVDINAGPKDGMIRTEADAQWVQAMMSAGYTFNGVKTFSKDQLWYGDFIYADLNGDGNYGNSYDRYFSGHSSSPSYNLGINIGFEWKGIEFSMIWAGCFDYYLQWSAAYYNRPIVRKGYSISSRIAADHYFYDPENPADSRTNINATYTRFTTFVTNNDASDFYEYKSDYMKLKNVTLAYNLPSKWMNKIFIQNLKLYVSGENLFCITGFPGMDPEIGTTIEYPLLRQYTIGAQITF